MERKLICPCFGYSKEDIVKDVIENKGISCILERILSEKKKGTCASSIILRAGDASQMSAVADRARGQE